jgi:hypothetical protein
LGWFGACGSEDGGSGHATFEKMSALHVRLQVFVSRHRNIADEYTFSEAYLHRYGSTSNAKAGSAANACTSATRARNNAATAAVGPFPIRSQITFGGGPCNSAKCRKSESFDTTIRFRPAA